MKPAAPLLHRPVEPRPVEVMGGWPMKPYRITADHPAAAVGVPWERQARRLIKDVMLAQRRSDDSPEAGFVVLHYGTMGNWLLVDWWRGDVLFQELFFGPPGSERFGPPPANAVACSFELVVTDHERRSWARHILGSHVDMDGYLSDTIAIEGGQPYV